MAFVRQRTTVERNGEPVTVPDYDVCRLSYYLRCCTLSCGIDIIADDLVDFRNAHRLPPSRQLAIFELAAGPFKASNMIGKTIFLDENGSLCGNSSYTFYELTTVRNILAVTDVALIDGQQTQVNKIMVFEREWLKRNYIEPIDRFLTRRLVRAILD